MNPRITHLFQRIGDALVTAVALAWFGLIGDHGSGVTTRTEIDVTDGAGSRAGS